MEKCEKIMRNGIETRNADEQKLVEICLYITSNYESLKEELKHIEQILKTVEVCSFAYLKNSMIAMHLRRYCETTITFNIIENILKKLDLVRENASLEFMQNVDLLKISSSILNAKIDDDVIRVVWDANKILQYIIYEINRINNVENIDKKVAILKGMIMYY